MLHTNYCNAPFTSSDPDFLLARIFNRNRSYRMIWHITRRINPCNIFRQDAPSAQRSFFLSISKCLSSPCKTSDATEHHQTCFLHPPTTPPSITSIRQILPDKPAKPSFTSLHLPFTIPLQFSKFPVDRCSVEFVRIEPRVVLVIKLPLVGRKPVPALLSLRSL